jgi:hypothetical protein
MRKSCWTAGNENTRNRYTKLQAAILERDRRTCGHRGVTWDDYYMLGPSKG